MSKLWSDAVSDLCPYVPGEQPKILNLTKLNTNENPYGPSPKAIAAIESVERQVLRRYPDPDSSKLCSTIADYYGDGLSAENVFVGNGSDEVLAHAFFAFFKKKKPILFPDITYGFYPVYCGLFNIDFQQIMLNEHFEIDFSKYNTPNDGIVLANPNATTGIYCELDSIAALLKAHPNSVILVDEAYIDFGGESAVKLIQEHRNLLVVQTLSKSRSLAGLRIGLAIGHKDLIEALRRVKDSFNSYPLDTLAQAAAIAAFEDEAYFRDTVSRILATREALTNALSSRGFRILPSKANFILAGHLNVPAVNLYDYLREQGILVRFFNKPRLDNFLRITIGTDQECNALIQALDDSDFEFS